MRIGERQKGMRGKKNRLKEIQDQLDVLMDEVHRLRANIASEGRRRTYPFPFERSLADDDRQESFVAGDETKH